MRSLFDILGLPATFALNLATLEKAYFAAQRATHPDRFIGKPEAQRLEAVRHSTLVNDAYETLKNPLIRAEHLLELQGIAALSDDTKVPSAILMEMMELRERVMDAGADGAVLAGMVAEIKALAAANEKALAEAFAAADFVRATSETIRLQYFGKAMEETHMLIYRLKAANAHG
jgi:molecular chaperone HscB